MVRVTTWPACFIRYSSRRNSRGCSVDLLAAAGDPVRQPVELEIADPVDWSPRRAAAAARQHLDAGQQFGEGIGLGQIVVAAGAQALDAVVDLAERREDQRRRVGRPSRAGVPITRQAVALRQHAVDDQHVVLPPDREREPLLAVGGEIRDVADLAKRLDQVVGGSRSSSMISRRMTDRPSLPYGISRAGYCDSSITMARYGRQVAECMAHRADGQKSGR